MILSLQTTPLALLMQGLRPRQALVHIADATPGSKAQKPGVTPHWIDFLNDDEAPAQR